MEERKIGPLCRLDDHPACSRKECECTCHERKRPGMKTLREWAEWESTLHGESLNELQRKVEEIDMEEYMTEHMKHVIAAALNNMPKNLKEQIEKELANIAGKKEAPMIQNYHYHECVPGNPHLGLGARRIYESCHPHTNWENVKPVPGFSAADQEMYGLRIPNFHYHDFGKERSYDWRHAHDRYDPEHAQVLAAAGYTPPSELPAPLCERCHRPVPASQAYWTGKKLVHAKSGDCMNEELYQELSNNTPRIIASFVHYLPEKLGEAMAEELKKAPPTPVAEKIDERTDLERCKEAMTEIFTEDQLQDIYCWLYNRGHRINR